VGSAVAKLPIEQVVKSMWPFFIILFSVLLLVTYVPAISLWLPRLMGV
jgi:TRAP-type C4-dicarboxylate transport system permease large subunit